MPVKTLAIILFALVLKCSAPNAATLSKAHRLPLTERRGVPVRTAYSQWFDSYEKVKKFIDNWKLIDREEQIVQ